MTLLRKLWSSEDGQGMAEYGLIIALVALVVIAGLTLLGPVLSDLFTSIAQKIDPTAGTTP